jgi:hypothetical protein
VKEEDGCDDPPLCVKEEPLDTFSPPPSPPRLPGKAKKAKLLVRLPWKVISVLGCLLLLLTLACICRGVVPRGLGLPALNFLSHLLTSPTTCLWTSLVTSFWLSVPVSLQQQRLLLSKLRY